ncbi:MAG: hypothetical protein ACRELV_15330 [Longimicrobiales bacterium]
MTDRSPARLAHVGIVLALALAACDAPVGPEVHAAPGPLAPAHLGNSDGAVSTPFRAHFFTVGQGLTVDPACGDPPNLLNTQVGMGEATHLGQFSVFITFCNDVTDVLDGQLTAGESVPYDDGFGILTAANGDELFFEISGEVVPSTDPAYDFEFQDAFTFVGGTGRFAGATGEGMTDSFVDLSTDRTDHEWVAILDMPAGR